MQLTTPLGTVEDDPSEQKIVELVNNMDPSTEETIRLEKSDDDWVEASMTPKGLVMKTQDPTTGLTLRTTGPYLSKPNVILVLKSYLNEAANWNTHAQWLPMGDAAPVAAGKKGCLGLIVLAVLSLAAIPWIV